MNGIGKCTYGTGLAVGACGFASTIAVLSWIALAAIFCAAGLTTSFNPNGLSNMWTVTKWLAISTAIGVGLVAIGICCVRQS